MAIDINIQNIDQQNLMIDIIYEVLSDYVLSRICPEDLWIYHGNFYSGEVTLPSTIPDTSHIVNPDDEDEVVEDSEDDNSPWDAEFLYLSCCVCSLNHEDYERHQGIEYIIVSELDGLCDEDMLVENMITFIDKKNLDKVITYQIIGKNSNQITKAIKKSISDGLLGCSAQTYNVLRSDSYNKGNIEESLGEIVSLKLKRLPYSVKSESDISMSN